MGLLNSKPRSRRPKKEIDDLPIDFTANKENYGFLSPPREHFQYGYKYLVGYDDSVYQYQRTTIISPSPCLSKQKYYSFAEIIRNDKRIILLYSKGMTLDEITSYDTNFNMISYQEYPRTIPADKMLHVTLLNDKEYICQTERELIIHDFKEKSDFFLFYSITYFHYRVLENKNIVVIYNFLNNCRSFSIRTYDSQNKYSFSDTRYHLPVSPLIETYNLIFTHILPLSMMAYYDVFYQYDSIIDVYQNKETYQVIRKSGNNIIVDRWEQKYERWVLSNASLIIDPMIDPVTNINKLLNKSFLYWGTPYFNVAIIATETHDQWKIRMIEFLIKIDAIKAFSKSLLKIMIEFID